MLEKTKHSSPPDGEPKLPLVIVNPKSGGGSTQLRWSQLAADLRSHFGPFTVALTKKQGDGIDLAKKFIGSGRRMIIACGGDGTINEVANGILLSGEEVELGILPAGTGGDFRRSIGMSSVPREAARQLKEGRTKTIDVGRLTCTGSTGSKISRYFLNVASFGLSASINNRVKKKGDFQWIPGETVRGKAKFALSTLQEVLESEYNTVRVSVDGGTGITLHTLNFCVCNSRYFGGGMKIAPNALLDDGFLDLVNIGDINTARILINGYKLYSGSHLTLPEVKSSLIRRIEVSPINDGERIDIEADGELPGRLPAVFEVIPKKLRIRVPGD